MGWMSQMFNSQETIMWVDQILFYSVNKSYKFNQFLNFFVLAWCTASVTCVAPNNNRMFLKYAMDYKVLNEAVTSSTLEIF